MTQVIANMSVSLDGFVADEDDRVDLLFGWYGSGSVVTPKPLLLRASALSP